MAKKAIVTTIEEKLQNALVPDWEWPYKLPENWCWTRLGEIGETNIGLTYKPSNVSNEGTIVLRSSNIQDGLMDYDDLVKVDMDIPKNKMCEIGDILICARNGSKSLVGKCAIIDAENMSFGAFMALFRSKYNKLIYYYLNSHYFRNLIDKDVGTTTINQVTQSILKELTFPLPPLAEQKQIVDRIESLFAKLDEAKELAQNALDSFENRKSAILHKAFTGELTKKWREENGVSFDSWEETTLGNISKIVRGGSPRPAGDERFYNGDIPFMKVADITRNSDMYVYSAQYSIKEAGLKKTRLVPKGTLLLTNSGATLGVPAITQIDTTFNDGIAAFLELNEDSQFLYYFLTNKTTEFRSINKGAAQPNLNTEIIGDTAIHLPTLPEQQEIVRILDSIFAKESEAKELVSVIDKIDLIKKSILSKAFRGELGTNDATEESSVGLLKEILEGE